MDASNDALTVSSPNTADSTIAGVVNDSNPLTGHFTLPDEYISELAIFPYDFSSFNEHAVISLMSEFNSAIYSLLHDQSCPNNQRSTLSDMNDELTNAFMSAPTVALFESLSPRLNRIRKYMLVPAFIRRDKALKQTPAPSSSTVGTSSLSATCFNPPALPTGPIPMVPYASSEKYQVHKPSNCIIRDCKFNAPSVTGADAHTLSQLTKILQPDITKTEATQFVTLLSAFHEASNVYSSDKYFDWTQTFIGAAAPFLPTIAERGAKDLTEAFFPESSSNHCIAAPLNPQEFAFQISSTPTAPHVCFAPPASPLDAATCQQQVDEAAVEINEYFPMMDGVFCTHLVGNVAYFSMIPQRYLQLYAREIIGLRIQKIIHHVLRNAEKKDADGKPLLTVALQQRLAELISLSRANNNYDYAAQYNDDSDSITPVSIVLLKAFPKLQAGYGSIQRIRKALYDVTGRNFFVNVMNYFKTFDFDPRLTYAQLLEQYQAAPRLIREALSLMGIDASHFGLDLSKLSDENIAAFILLAQIAAAYHNISSSHPVKAWLDSHPNWKQDCTTDSSAATTLMNDLLLTISPDIGPPKPPRVGQVKRNSQVSELSSHPHAAVLDKKPKPAPKKLDYGGASYNKEPSNYEQGFNYAIIIFKATLATKAPMLILAKTVKAVKWILPLFKLNGGKLDLDATTGLQFVNANVNWVNCTTKQSRFTAGQKGFLAFLRLVFGYPQASRSRIALPDWLPALITLFKEGGFDLSNIETSN